jgi:hypothetical protein
MSFFDFIGNVDRRYIYVLLVVLIIYPLVNPIGLPLGKSPETDQVFSTVENLPPNSIVILSPDYSPGAEAELWPQTVAITHHLMQKGHRIIALSLWADGVMYARRAMETIGPQYNYVNGVDYIVMPWVAGRDAAVSAMGRDFRSVYQVDFYGVPTASLPMFEDIQDIKDIALVVSYATGDDMDYYLQQLQAIYGTPVTGGCTAVSSPGRMPYLATGQLSGFLSGLRGAAEYEVLVKVPGLAAAGMDAQSLSHAMVIVFIILGNLAYLLGRKRPSTAGGDN